MLDSFLRPTQIKTNQDGGLLRLIACVCMFIDHAGKMLFPQLTWMRMVGRLAFPLFAYGIAVGAAMTRHPRQYIARVAALALVSQPLYAVALGHTNEAMYAVPFAQHPLRALCTFYMESWEKPSILLALLLGLLLLLCLREKQYVPALLIYVLCARFSAELDYGVSGGLLPLSGTPGAVLCRLDGIYARLVGGWARLPALRHGVRHAHIRHARSHARQPADSPQDPNAQMAFLRVLPGAPARFARAGKIFLKKRLTDGGEYDILSLVQKLRLTQSSYNFILGNCVTAAPTTLTRIV